MRQFETMHTTPGPAPGMGFAQPSTATPWLRSGGPTAVRTHGTALASLSPVPTRALTPDGITHAQTTNSASQGVHCWNPPAAMAGQAPGSTGQSVPGANIDGSGNGDPSLDSAKGQRSEVARRRSPQPPTGGFPNQDQGSEVARRRSPQPASASTAAPAARIRSTMPHSPARNGSMATPPKRAAASYSLAPYAVVATQDGATQPSVPVASPPDSQDSSNGRNVQSAPQEIVAARLVQPQPEGLIARNVAASPDIETLGSVVSAQEPARVRELEAQVRQMQQQLACVTSQNGMGASQVATELENAQLRAQLNALMSSAGSAASTEKMSPAEIAAQRLTRAAKSWLLRRRKQELLGSSSAARDRWKQALGKVEVVVNGALERALAQTDVARVTRQTRLQLLGNALKQGVLKVNQAMMQQTLQDMRQKDRKSLSSVPPAFPSSTNAQGAGV